MSKPAGAVASIFEAGKAAKPIRSRTMPPPNDVEIRKGVPIPMAIRDKVRQDFFGGLISRMQDGDMVELELPHARSLRSRAKKLGVEVTVRVLPSGKIGVWRVGALKSQAAA